MTTIKCDFNSDPCDGINNNSNIIISSSNIYNKSMSNPSNANSVQFPTYSFTTTNIANPTSTANIVAPGSSNTVYSKPVGSTTSTSLSSSSVADSFFSIANAKKEWYAALPEIVLVFGLSFGISMYMGDEAMTAVKRGSFMAVGQYTAQIAVDMMPAPVSNNQVYLYNVEKFAIATSIFIGGNKYVIGSQQPLANLFGESVVASIVAHYSANATRNAINSTSSIIHYK